ncbi:hypothetical protein D3C87_1891650 [compost metagenome]
MFEKRFNLILLSSVGVPIAEDTIPPTNMARGNTYAFFSTKVTMAADIAKKMVNCDTKTLFARLKAPYATIPNAIGCTYFNISMNLSL